MCTCIIGVGSQEQLSGQIHSTSIESLGQQSGHQHIARTQSTVVKVRCPEILSRAPYYACMYIH